MAKYIGPVCKLCRREGEKMFLKGARCFTPKCAFEKRALPPVNTGAQARAGVAAVVTAVACLIMAVSCVPNRKPAVYMVYLNANSAVFTDWL